jgi:hypothetical protein
MEYMGDSKDLTILGGIASQAPLCPGLAALDIPFCIVPAVNVFNAVVVVVVQDGGGVKDLL